VLGAALDAAVGVAGVALAGLDGHLGLAVAVQIVDHVGRVPDAPLDRPAEVVPPEKRAVVEVGLELVRFRARLPIVDVRVDVAVRLLDDEIVTAVGVQVGDSHLLERVVACELDGNVGGSFLTGRGSGLFRGEPDLVTSLAVGHGRSRGNARSILRLKHDHGALQRLPVEHNHT